MSVVSDLLAMAIIAPETNERDIMSRQQLQDLDADLRAHPLVAETLEERRAAFAAFMARETIPAGLRTTGTEAGGVRAVRVERETDPRPGAILYFHGGAWTLGSPETELPLTGELVARTGIPAVSVDYRLAPEHPFPAGADDGVAAYRALLESGVDPSAIAIAGASAGGGMTVATILGARDAGLPMPAAAVLMSPGLDQTRSGASMTTRGALDPVLSREALLASGPVYVRDADPLDPRLSPVLTADLAGFPPLLIQVGTHEILFDDATRMADRAREADVDVILDVVAGAPHVFPMFTAELDEAHAALDRAALFLRQHLA
jgi:epsilon-lactone hydrolase